MPVVITRKDIGLYPVYKPTKPASHTFVNTGQMQETLGLMRKEFIAHSNCRRQRVSL